MTKHDRALRNVSYGMGLQVFIGVGFILFSLVGQEVPEFMVGPRVTGGLLVMLAVNSLVYVARYKKVLKEEG